MGRLRLSPWLLVALVGTVAPSPIAQTPEGGVLTIMAKANAGDPPPLLSCKLKGNELVSWKHKDDDAEEWSDLVQESGESLNPRPTMEKEKTQEHQFRCEIGEDTADFTVKINGTLGSKKHKHFRVLKFDKSYEVTEGQDFKRLCEVDLRDDENMNNSLISYKWYKWTEKNDQSFQPKEDEGKPNCRVSNQTGSKWVEITDPEMIDGEIHIQRLMINNKPSKIKIDDANRDDRRGYKCIVYNENDESICSESAFFLRVKDKFAVLYPSVGILAEIVVLLIIIFACEKAKGSGTSGSGSGGDDDEYNGNALRSDSSVRHRRT